MTAGAIGTTGSGIGPAISGAIGLLGALAVSRRKRVMFKRAYRLAVSANIELPARLVDHVIRFLRRQLVAGVLGGLLLAVLVNVTFSANHGSRFWAIWIPWLAVALPLFVIAFSFVMTLWPRWQASGAPRITHARRLSPRHAFTSAEYAVVVLGGILSAVGAAWGLRHVDAPTWIWCLAIASACLSVFVWWSCVGAIMNRPTSASDVVELRWDDMLRFQSVRNLSVFAAWGPAVLFLVTDWWAVQVWSSGASGRAGASGGTFLPLYLVAGAVALVAIVFQQGRQLWRTAWA